jgi:(p)ppGpp synthase/HD superfamily hydrolase
MIKGNVKDYQLAVAELIATQAHKGQKRWGGEEYIIHPRAVASSMDTKDEKIVAWLHDVIEDTELRGAGLSIAGITKEDVKIIGILTKAKHEDYIDYILRCKTNKIATKVKLADLNHNLSDLKAGSMRDKYLMAKYILEEETQKNE